MFQLSIGFIWRPYGASSTSQADKHCGLCAYFFSNDERQFKKEGKKSHFWMTWNQAHPHMTELYIWGAWSVFFETRICRQTHSQTLSDIHLTLHYLFLLAYLCSNPLSNPAHTHSTHRAAGLSFESVKFHRPWTKNKKKRRKNGVKGREGRNTAKVITWFLPQLVLI